MPVKKIIQYTKKLVKILRFHVVWPSWVCPLRGHEVNCHYNMIKESP